MNKWIIAMMIVLFMYSLTYSNPADALSCAEPPAVKEEFDSSSYVFRGEVKDRKQTDQGPRISFRILEIWKGTATTEINVYISNMWLEPEGKQYLIYASKRDYAGEKVDELWANLCGRTTEWHLAKGDIHQFGKPGIRIAGTDGGTDGEPDDGTSPFWIILAGAVLFLVITLIYGLLNKRRKGDNH